MIRGASAYERSRLPLFLTLGGLLGMALLNWHLATTGIDISPAPASGAAEPALPSAADWVPDDAVAGDADAAAYPQMLARPLFRASRRPPDVATPQIAAQSGVMAQPVAKLPEDIQLVGIMMPTGGSGRALIRSGASPTGQWVEIGHVLEGWRVSQIEASSVLFETKGEKRQLSLFPPKEQ